MTANLRDKIREREVAKSLVSTCAVLGAAAQAQVHGLQSFFKTPGKAQPEKIVSQRPAESPQTAQKPQQPYLQLFTPAPERARSAQANPRFALCEESP